VPPAGTVAPVKPAAAPVGRGARQAASRVAVRRP
jgi:hypothetical protein